MRKLFHSSTLLLVLVFCLSCLFACDKSASETSQRENELAAAAREQTQLEFAYVADTHFMSAEEIGHYAYESFVEREISAQKMNHISEALFSEFCDKVIEQGKEYLFIGGDISETGSLKSHQGIVAELNRVKEAGIKVYVVPGNHDTNQVCYDYTAEGRVMIEPTHNKDFAELYADFGYTGTRRIESNNDNLEYTGALSYSVDLNDKYTLIAFDNTSGTTDDYNTRRENIIREQNNEAGVDVSTKPTDASLKWLIEEIARTTTAGRIPLLMMHCPLTEIFTGLNNIGGLISPSGTFVGDDNEEYKSHSQLGRAMYDAGLRYVLAGHMHSNDLMRTDYVADELGIYQFMNSTISTYNSTYHNFRFTENYMDITPVAIPAPKLEFLPSYLSDEEKALIVEDWVKYTYEFCKEDFENKILPVFSSLGTYLSEYVLNKSYKTMTDDEQIKVDNFVNGLLSYLNMPFKSENGENSIESLLRSYGYQGTLPNGEACNLLDAILDIVTTCFTAGEKDLTSSSNDWVLIKYGVYGLIATISNLDLFGLMEDFGIEVENIDTRPMITNLLQTGKLDLGSYNVVENLLNLPILANVDGLIAGVINLVKDDVWGTLGMPIIDLLVGTILNGSNLFSYFEIDEEETSKVKEGVVFSGVIDMDGFMDKLVFEFIGEGLFYDNLGNTTNLLVNLKTGAVYDK